MSMEEVLGVELMGFPSQYAGDWKIVRPEKKLVGRAVTLLVLPLRPEVADVHKTALPPMPGGRITHQTAINLLQKDDVLVIDARAVNAGMVGDNLATYINDVGAGFVIDGGIRDLDGISKIGMTGYYRGVTPSACMNCMVGGINVPVTVGNVTVLPGDVVLGDAEGVYFIPPKVVEQLADRADEVHIHDQWTKMKFAQGVGEKGYKSTDIYSRPHDPALIKEYQEFLKEHLDALRKQRQQN
jgi:regulator of RNase E activity RraA